MFNRVFLIVLDSVGIGEEPDAALFDDVGSNTLLHAAQSVKSLHVPYMSSLGLGNIANAPGVISPKTHPQSYALALEEASYGKDTMTGHWEMMGLLTTKPFKTFTDTGFPKELISELEKLTGHKIIGNKSASGTEILKELGEEQMRDNSLIVYTSADSVLQIAASEEVTGLEELYRCCEIARELTLRPEWRVGRVIARPYIGNNPSNFKRTSNRHDYTLSPSGKTALDVLKEHNLSTIGVGKINDIFNGVGISESYHTVSNMDGMDKVSSLIEKDFKGLCFVNLVEFDSEFGHRRNPVGYARALEQFDERLGEIMPRLRNDDLLLITADHGNDPTFKGTDHTREKVPLLAYSPSYKRGTVLENAKTFAVIGATILENFNLKKAENTIGAPLLPLLEKSI